MNNFTAFLIFFLNVYFQSLICEASFGETSDSDFFSDYDLYEVDHDSPKFPFNDNAASKHIEETRKSIMNAFQSDPQVHNNPYSIDHFYGTPYSSSLKPSSFPSNNNKKPSSSSSSESSFSSSSSEEKHSKPYQFKPPKKGPPKTFTTVHTTYSSSGFPSYTSSNPPCDACPPKVKPVPIVSSNKPSYPNIWQPAIAVGVTGGLAASAATKPPPSRPSSTWPVAGAALATGLAGGYAASAATKPPPPRPSYTWPVAGAALATGAAGGLAAKPTHTAQPLPASPANTKPKCNYCIRPSCKATVTSYPNFNAKADSDRLRKAVKGLGTDENTLIDILTSRSEEQVNEIVDMYHTHGPALKDDIEGDTSFKFKKILLALITPLKFYYADQLHKALKKGDSSTLIEIMTSLSPCAIREISSAYDLVHDDSLVDTISSNTYLNFKKFILALAKGNRNEDQQVNKAAARKDAEALINAGVKKWFGTDTSTFIDIFSTRSFPQLREVLAQYDALRKPSSIEGDIDKEFSDKLKKGLLKLVGNIKDQPASFAVELKDSLKGWSIPGPSNNDKLVRILRGRCRIDLGDIQDAYNKIYKPKTLAKHISDETYFEYQRALLALIGVKNK